MSRLTHLIDLASRRLGGAVLAANDEFFASKGQPAQARAGDLDSRQVHRRGKWMDGWETRRRRTPGHDWCIVKLGLPGVDSLDRGRHRVLSGQFSVALFDRRLRILGGVRSERAQVAAARRPERAARRRGERLRCRWLAARSRTFVSTFSQTVAWRDCACWARRLPDWRRPRTPAGSRSRDRQRRPHRRRQRSILRRTGQHADAGHRREHGRGLGDKRRRGPGHDWVVIRLGTEGTITAWSSTPPTSRATIPRAVPSKPPWSKSWPAASRRT